MPIDSDAAFVSEVKLLGHAQPGAEAFLQQVVVRLSARMAGWNWVRIDFLVEDTLVRGPSAGDLSDHVTRSELVVPIRYGDQLVGQFAVGSDTVAAFRRQDEVLLERLGAIVSAPCRSERARLATGSAASE